MNRMRFIHFQTHISKVVKHIRNNVSQIIQIITAQKMNIPLKNFSGNVTKSKFDHIY